MSKLGIKLSRAMLAEVLADLARERKQVYCCRRKAYVMNLGGGQWGFHLGAYYWHGRAANAYAARTHGWAAWMRANGVKGYAITEVDNG